MALERVESERFPYLPLTLTVGEQTAQVEALLDTGFDGDIVVPLSLIANDQPPDEYRNWALADGSRGMKSSALDGAGREQDRRVGLPPRVAVISRGQYSALDVTRHPPHA